MPIRNLRKPVARCESAPGVYQNRDFVFFDVARDVAGASEPPAPEDFRSRSAPREPTDGKSDETFTIGIKR